MSDRVAEIRQRLQAWLENCAEEGGDPDMVAVFEVHSADDIAYLLTALDAAVVEAKMGSALAQIFRTERDAALQRAEQAAQERDKAVSENEAAWNALHVRDQALLKVQDERDTLQRELTALRQQVAASGSPGRALVRGELSVLA